MHPATRYALSAVLLWSTVATAFKLTLRNTDPMTLVAWASLISWAALGVMVWRGGYSKSLRAYGRRAWPRILLLGSLVPPLYYGVLFRVANLIYLSPPISLFLIHWLAGEPIYPSTIVAWPLVLSGVFLSQSRRQVEN